MGILDWVVAISAIVFALGLTCATPDLLAGREGEPAESTAGSSVWSDGIAQAVCEICCAVRFP